MKDVLVKTISYFVAFIIIVSGCWYFAKDGLLNMNEDIHDSFKETD